MREPLQIGGRVVYRPFRVGAVIIDIHEDLFSRMPTRYDVRADNGAYIRNLPPEDLEVIQ